MFTPVPSLVLTAALRERQDKGGQMGHLSIYSANVWRKHSAPRPRRLMRGRRQEGSPGIGVPLPGPPLAVHFWLYHLLPLQSATPLKSTVGFPFGRDTFWSGCLTNLGGVVGTTWSLLGLRGPAEEYPRHFKSRSSEDAPTSRNTPSSWLALPAPPPHLTKHSVYKLPTSYEMPLHASLPLHKPSLLLRMPLSAHVSCQALYVIKT